MLAHLFVDRLHPLRVERSGVFDTLFADDPEPRILGGVLFFGSEGVDDPARAESLEEGRIIRIVLVFRLLVGVEMVEVAKELIEAVGGRQVLIAVAEVVLAELPGGVTKRLEQLGDDRVLFLQAFLGAD
jgi:hypothetical protein